jgi:transposase InsO family protein
MDREALVEYRYRAVMEVLGGSPIGEVAARYGTSRQSVHAWRQRFRDGGNPGLADRSRRPHHSPRRLSADIEAEICDLRRRFPRWGARRISFELRQQEVPDAPSRATVHRVLTRNGMVNTQTQEHKRVYRRWQREAPMHLWQLDLVGGVPLADGREAKMLTGIDDHSRFVVVSAVMVIPSGRAVCEAFTAAIRRYGAPFEVLTDNGRQFTGRHTKPLPVEVMFEKLLRDNGIVQRLTKPRSPTTTGKIERWHKTLREELLHNVAPFESLAAAQHAIDEWVSAYNHQRPHQALDMATPASRFRPNGPTRPDQTPPSTLEIAAVPQAPAVTIGIAEPEPATAPSDAVELEVLVPPSGQTSLLQGRIPLVLKQGMAGRTVTVWASLRHVHIVLDGHLLRSTPTRLTPEDLQQLRMRGARPGRPLNEFTGIPRTYGKPVLGQAVEVERSVQKDGHISLDGTDHYLGVKHAGRRVTLRLDGHLMHAICDNALIATWPCPIPIDRLPTLIGARTASDPLPRPALPAGSIQVHRRVYTSGRIMVNNQFLKLGTRHAGKTVTVIIEDTHYRVLHGEEEIAVKARKNTTPITRLYVKANDTRKPRSG